MISIIYVQDVAKFLLLKLYANVPESTVSKTGLTNVQIGGLYIVYQNQSLLPSTSTFKVLRRRCFGT